MLTPADRASLLAHARRSVQNITGRRHDAMPPSPAPFSAPSGAFTTLHAAGGDLRGCIGFVEPRFSLWETVWRTAAEAASQDHRFDPVAPDEVPGLKIEISVLVPPQPAHPADVRVGIHGILLSRGSRRGLLLPQVAVERGWDAETFLDAACEKASLPRGSWKDGARLEIFTAEVFSE